MNNSDYLYEDYDRKETLHKFNEWMTLASLKASDAISSFTRNKREIRKSLYGGENRNARLTNCYYNPNEDTMTFEFKTTPTYKAHDPDYKADITDPHNNFKMMSNPFGKYTMEIQIVDFMKWLGTRPQGSGPITRKELKEIFDSAYVRLFCNCGAFQYQTANYVLSQLDASIYPTNIAPKKWNKIHGDYNCLCKHLSALLKSYDFFSNQMAATCNKALKNANINL